MTSTPQKKTSFHVHLEELPDVITLKGLEQSSGLSHASAKKALSTWKNRGFVTPFARKMGVYFNTYKNRQAKDEFWLSTLHTFFPSAVFAGTNILREAGWMTQIASQKEIVTLQKQRLHQVIDVEWMPRKKSWFKKYKEGIIISGPRRELLPEYALVDLCEAGKYIPDPDDLFLDETEMVKIKDAFAKLKVDIPPKLWEVLEYEPKSTPKTTKKARP